MKCKHDFILRTGVGLSDCISCNIDARDYIKHLEHKLTMALECLEKYADEDNWQSCNCHDPMVVCFVGQVEFYGNEIAQQCLAAIDTAEGEDFR